MKDPRLAPVADHSGEYHPKFNSLGRLGATCIHFVMKMTLYAAWRMAAAQHRGRPPWAEDGRILPTFPPLREMLIAGNRYRKSISVNRRSSAEVLQDRQDPPVLGARGRKVEFLEQPLPFRHQIAQLSPARAGRTASLPRRDDHSRRRRGAAGVRPVRRAGLPARGHPAGLRRPADAARRREIGTPRAPE